MNPEAGGITRREVLVGVSTTAALGLSGCLLGFSFGRTEHPHLKVTGQATASEAGYLFEATITNLDARNAHTGELVCTVIDSRDSETRWEEEIDVELPPNGMIHRSLLVSVPATEHPRLARIELGVYKK